MAIEWLKAIKSYHLSESAHKILDHLEQKGNASASELHTKLNVSTRTIHYALKNLMEKDLVDKKPYLKDMRQTRYSLNTNKIRKIQQDLVRKGLIYTPDYTMQKLK